MYHAKRGRAGLNLTIRGVRLSPIRKNYREGRQINSTDAPLRGTIRISREPTAALALRLWATKE